MSETPILTRTLPEHTRTSSPPLPLSLRQHLKSETAEAHDRLDGLAAYYDLHDDADLATFCLWMHRGFYLLEQRILSSGAESVFPDWQPALPHAHVSDRGGPRRFTPEDCGRALGLLYVHMGSRLGALVLQREYPKLSLRSPVLFGALSNGWRAFVDVLDEQPPDAALHRTATASALDAFQMFVDQHALVASLAPAFTPARRN